MKWGVRRRAKLEAKNKQYWDQIKKQELNLSIDPHTLSKRMDND